MLEMNYRILLILIFSLALSVNQFAQQSVADSLEKQLNNLSGEEKIETLDKLADIYQYINTKNAIEFAHKGIELAKKINDPKGLASCYGSLGFCYTSINVNKALFYTKKALKIREKIKFIKGIATSLNVMGVINYYKGEYLSSIDYHLKALKIRQELGNDNNLAVSYNNISLVYLALEDYKTALQYLNKGLVLREKTKNQNGIAIIKGNIGEVFSRMGKYDTALKYLNDALKINKEIGSRKSEGAIYLTLAKVYMQISNIEKAFKDYNLALELYSSMGDKHGIAVAEDGIAAIYQQEKKTELAIKHALSAFTFADSINSLDNIASAANILQAEYYKQGNIKKAFHYLTIFKNVSDSLKITDKIKKLAKTEFDYKIHEIKEKQNAEITKQQIFIKWLTITLLLGVIIIALIIFGYVNKRKINKQLNKLNYKLKELNATKDRFFSIVAHDLRGPFHSLLAFSDALSNDIDELSTEEIKSFNTDINKSLKKQFALLNNLLDWARLQNENYKLKFEDVDLYDIINEIMDTLSFTAEQKEIKLINDVSKNIIVNADKNMLQLVLRNLISNSIKFSNVQGIIKVTSLYKEGHVEIKVSDKGVGIPSEDLDKIFRIDVHYTTQGTFNEKGTGLGLILCKEIIEKHGGEISISSELGKGTDISFTLKTA
jgi:signal transduction histidine kinase